MSIEVVRQQFHEFGCNADGRLVFGQVHVGQDLGVGLLLALDGDFVPYLPDGRAWAVTAVTSQLDRSHGLWAPLLGRRLRAGCWPVKGGVFPERESGHMATPTPVPDVWSLAPARRK